MITLSSFHFLFYLIGAFIIGFLVCALTTPPDRYDY